MSDAVVTGATSIIVAAIGVLGIYIGRVLGPTRLAAEAAERNSKPVSNGWSGRTTAALERIEAEQQRQAAALVQLTTRLDNHIDRKN